MRGFSAALASTILGLTACLPQSGVAAGPLKTDVAALPTPATTGWRHTGVTLRPCPELQAGGRYVLRGRPGGATYEGCDFEGAQVRITGPGAVTLRRSRVAAAANCDSACAAILVAEGAGPVLIEDVEVTNSRADEPDESRRQDRTIAISKNNDEPVRIRRVLAYGTTRGMDLTGQSHVTLEDCFLAFNTNPGSGERKHASALRIAGGAHDIVIRNTVLGVGPSSYASGLIALYPEYGPNHDIVVEGGLWIIGADNAGAYGIAVGGVEARNYNIVVRDVQISTHYYKMGCPSGCGQNWVGSKAPLGRNEWTGVRRYNPGARDHGLPIGP